MQIILYKMIDINKNIKAVYARVQFSFYIVPQVVAHQKLLVNF